MRVLRRPRRQALRLGARGARPAAAPPPAPTALSFEAWAELSLRLVDASPQVLAAALAAQGLTPEVWERLERAYLSALRDDVGVGYAPRLGVRQYVALSAELALEPASRAATLRRYQVPTEAALRMLEEDWRHPARRAELEGALVDFAVVVRGQALG
jgi:hypothetical protein